MDAKLYMLLILLEKLMKELLKRCLMHRKLMITLIALVFSSCTKDQFKAEIPSYIHIESIDLETDSFQGSDSQNLTDAWVTMMVTFWVHLSCLALFLYL